MLVRSTRVQSKGSSAAFDVYKRMLIDDFYVIIKIFKPEFRELYRIEKIWSENLVVNDETKIG